MKFIILLGIGMIMLFLFSHVVSADSQNISSKISEKCSCKLKFCETNLDCPKTHICIKTTIYPIGTCMKKGFCPLIINPVCGCDGRTYPNNCVADLFGICVKYKGKCK